MVTHWEIAVADDLDWSLMACGRLLTFDEEARIRPEGHDIAGRVERVDCPGCRRCLNVGALRRTQEALGQQFPSEFKAGEGR